MLFESLIISPIEFLALGCSLWRQQSYYIVIPLGRLQWLTIKLKHRQKHYIMSNTNVHLIKSRISPLCNITFTSLFPTCLLVFFLIWLSSLFVSFKPSCCVVNFQSWCHCLLYLQLLVFNITKWPWLRIATLLQSTDLTSKYQLEIVSSPIGLKD